MKSATRLLVVVFILSVFLVGCRNDFNQNWAHSVVGYKISKNTNKITIGVIDAETIVDGEKGVLKLKHIDLICDMIQKLVPQAKIIKYVLDDNTAESLAKGINELVSRGVDIINVSMGISSDNKELSTSIENATSKQIFVVCAAGNNFGDLLYPARYEKTISCLARSINGEDLYKDFAKITKMSFSAPGIHVPFSDDYFSGTSIACAYVTSQFAYAIVEKGSLDYEELFVKMQNSAVDSSEKSYGVIQMSML